MTPPLHTTRRAPLAAALALAALAACDDSNPAELRDKANTFPVRASWSAAAAPVAPATVRANLTIKEYVGSRMETAVSVTGGTPNASYQWRIFRGDCSTNTAAVNNAAPTGLLVVATVQSYPDVATNAAGTGTSSRVITAALDSLTAYSVRIRPSQTATNWNGTSPIACGNLQRS